MPLLVWEYKHIRLDYRGRGITMEINLLDIDGERIRGWVWLIDGSFLA